jgi:glycosyltransferase involved in cell wall biosynthesis
MAIEIKVPVEELRKRKLFLATPMYGGQCAGMFARSVADLTALCTHYGIGLQMYFLFNESLITRARNYCCDEFVRSDCTHLMFIDSDIGFNPQDVIAMLAMADDESPYDIISGPYPKKCISWEKVKMAVDKGFADEDANNLDKFVGDYVFNPKSGAGSIPINEPVEVLESGTGFMMIRKKTMLKFAEAFPQYYYKPDHVRTEHFDGTREIMQYFQAEIDPKSKRYLSEDYWFCQKVQEIGLQNWLCPWIKLQHVGTYIFGGSLADLAAVGASATADGDAMIKQRLKKKK